MYSDELNVQVLIALLKAHGITNVVVSPGGTNVSLVGSLQQDGFFRLFSAVDERHGVRQHDSLEVHAVAEGLTFNVADALGDRDGVKRVAAGKGIVGDRCSARGDRHAL